jgi:beta-fructofuranosidase
MQPRPPRTAHADIFSAGTPTRDQDKDDQRWHWGGNMVVHAIQQQADGLLTVNVPDTLERAWHKSLPFSFVSGIGAYSANEDAITVDSFGGFSCASAGELPNACFIRATMTFAEGTRSCGLMLRTSADFESGYYVRFEPARQRLVFDVWPRAGDAPFMHELERPINLKAGQPIDIKVLIDGTVCEIYACGKVALSTRLYNHAHGTWGVFASEGRVQCSDVSLMV